MMILPFERRMLNVLLVGGFFLIFSCQSNPIVLNPPGEGYEYVSQTFKLDISNSFSTQGDSHTGYSPRLYSGILNNFDTVSTLIQLKSEVFDSHQICNSDSMIDVFLELTLTEKIAILNDSTFIDTFIQMNALKAYLISDNNIVDIDEDVIITSETLIQILNLSNEEIAIEIKGENSIKLNLFDQDVTIIDKICEDFYELGIIISYFPTDSSYMEFYSSDDTDVGFGPKLSLEYAVKEEVSLNYNRYSINSVTWSDDFSDLNSGPYYVNDSLSMYWGTFYALDLNLDNSIISNPATLYDSMEIHSDIISNPTTLATTLFQIEVEINPEVANELDSIIFSLTDAVAFISDVDPTGDNKTESNQDGKENNLAYDDGEKFNDYGFDNCPDSLEAGQNVCGNSISLYNPTGTENNNNLDWVDFNANGAWDENEGERWWDRGIDGCEDKFEFGEDSCGTVENSIWTSGLDFNGDNYNIDPAQDDWDPIDSPNGTEGNGIFDTGELFLDWGSDGLPESVMGYKDETEDNNSYDQGEPFDDTGLDGLFNLEEIGYNKDGTENNNQFDNEGEFDDCGEDNICNSKDGDTNDDYNIDPNNDNMITDSTLTQSNFSLDWIDADNNNLWDEGEGEQWFDWGVDQIPDSLEAFQSSTLIIPNLYENSYIFDLDSQQLQVLPELTDSIVNLWVSNIEESENNIVTIDISIQAHVALKGLQFKLSHIPYFKVDTIMQTYEAPSLVQIGEEKIFKDFTLLPRIEYDLILLDTTLQIDYANNISTVLDFDSLDIFLSVGEYILSYDYTNLVLYVDSLNTNIEGNMLIYVAQENSFGEDELLSPESYASVIPSSDSIIIPLGQALKKYQSGNIESYDNLKLKAVGNLFNYSHLSIQNNPRLNVMYTK